MAQDDLKALVAQGAAVVKVENEMLQSVALQRPRDEQSVVEGALRELELVPDSAGKAYYSIPYKQDRPDGRTKIQNVEGPSINAAMSLARRWGNCTVGARVLHEDEGGFDVEGFFLDLETNFRVARPVRVSKFYKPRGGREARRLTPDREVMAVQSGSSKAMRNAILAGLPSYLVDAYDRRAREIVGGNLDGLADKKDIDASLSFFAKTWGATQEQLEQYLEKPAAEWTGQDIAYLRGLVTALNDRQATPEEIFSPTPRGRDRDLMPEAKALDAGAGQAGAPPTSTPPAPDVSSPAEPPAPGPLEPPAPPARRKRKASPPPEPATGSPAYASGALNIVDAYDGEGVGLPELERRIGLSIQDWIVPNVLLLSKILDEIRAGKTSAPAEFGGEAQSVG